LAEAEVAAEVAEQEEAVVAQEEAVGGIYNAIIKSRVYIMTRIVLLTDENIIEGLIGLFTLIITAYTLTYIIHAPRFVIFGMSFIISWYFRRIGINIYKYLKSNNIFSIKPLTYK
jgi:hypothetical protein